jgi:hypothetical protein
MTTYNFSFNTNLDNYLNENGLYNRLPTRREVEHTLIYHIKSPKDACGLALLWKWVENPSSFWKGVEGRNETALVKRLKALCPIEGAFQRKRSSLLREEPLSPQKLEEKAKRRALIEQFRKERVL